MHCGIAVHIHGSGGGRGDVSFNRGSSASGAFATLLRDNLIKKGILIRLQLLAVVSKILWALELTGMQTRPSNQLCLKVTLLYNAPGVSCATKSPAPAKLSEA